MGWGSPFVVLENFFLWLWLILAGLQPVILPKWWCFLLGFCNGLGRAVVGAGLPLLFCSNSSFALFVVFCIVGLLIQLGLL